MAGKFTAAQSAGTVGTAGYAHLLLDRNGSTVLVRAFRLQLAQLYTYNYPLQLVRTATTTSSNTPVKEDPADGAPSSRWVHNVTFTAGDILWASRLTSPPRNIHVLYHADTQPKLSSSGSASVALYHVAGTGIYNSTLWVEEV